GRHGEGHHQPGAGEAAHPVAGGGLMTELEERLRAGLSGLADSVPRTPNAWAEQERRRRPARRGPMLAAAAAAVGLAATVPATVLTHPAPAPSTGQPVTITAPRPTKGYDPSPDGPYLTITDGPMLLGEFSEGGTRWGAWVFLERHPAGTGWDSRLCVVGVP